MSHNTIPIVVFIVWVAVAVIGLGITREVTHDWDEVFDRAPFLVLWPVMLLFGAAVGVGWCLLWLGRGPVRLGRWQLNRRAARAAAKTNLPRAEIARRS